MTVNSDLEKFERRYQTLLELQLFRRCKEKENLTLYNAMKAYWKVETQLN